MCLIIAALTGSHPDSHTLLVATILRSCHSRHHTSTTELISNCLILRTVQSASAVRRYEGVLLFGCVKERIMEQLGKSLLESK